MRINLALPDLGQLERQYLIEAFDSGWLTSLGEFHSRFEIEFAKSLNVSKSLAVGNGTQALHLILLGLGIGPGDKVIVPSLTYIATANAVHYVGAEPIFADIDDSTWTITAETVDKVFDERTKAVIVVHLYGHPAPLIELSNYCKLRNIFLVEDAAEAPFAEADGVLVGTIGIASAFSFYANKVLVSGEGGAIACNDENLVSRMKQFRDQGMHASIRYYFPVVGYNYRMTNLQAAILLAQLHRRDELIESRIDLCNFYNGQLLEFKDIQFQPIASWAKWTPWLYSILLKSRSQRDSFMEFLNKNDIETRPFFIPLHTLPPYYCDLDLPITEDISSRGVNLPTWSNMPEISARRVINVIERFFNDRNN